MSRSIHRNLLAALLIAAVGTLPAFAAPAKPLDPALAAMVATFEKAFNAHNAPAMSALWTPDAVYRATNIGVEVTGRDPIASAYAALFQEQPGSTLKLTISESKIDGKTASLLGMAEVTQRGQLPTRSLFRASLARVGASWLFSNVEEAELPANSPTGMSQLGWLAGTWIQQLPSGDVKNTYHWVDGGAFLVRNYSRVSKQAPAASGTQIFGWDAEQQCIRTWLFDSNGTFGEGYWERQSSNKWVNKMALKLPDGRRGSATQILTRSGDNELTLQSVDREMDGQFQPNTTPAKMSRQMTGNDDAAAKGAKQ
ncbi:YybH family protein [Lacipirellula sp.]|uniref:YybH family protein n=1 Tax=Lacipirellula sp. TaxID=2691419 RepID=UPI003D144A8D